MPPFQSYQGHMLELSNLVKNNLLKKLFLGMAYFIPVVLKGVVPGLTALSITWQLVRSKNSQYLLRPFDNPSL